MSLPEDTLIDRWHPIARSEELAPGHVYHGRLLGEELALWRDDNGRANAWDNRCPHRGMRLTMGDNLGSELRCRYHGLRFSSVSGRCSVVPAHPDRAIREDIRPRVRSVAERYGWVWVSLADRTDEPVIAALAGAAGLTLRSIVVWAAAPVVAAALRHYRFVPTRALETQSAIPRMNNKSIDRLVVSSSSALENESGRVVLVVQPADECKSVIHGFAVGAFEPPARKRILRHHSQMLTELRDAIESAAPMDVERSGGALHGAAA